MNVYLYDFEVFAFDWLIVLKHIKTGQRIKIHNNPEKLKALFGNRDNCFIGANTKHYDKWIANAICTGADNATVKHLNDFIIQGNNGWEHYWFTDHRFKFNNVDLFDDTSYGFSLKAFEGHMFMNIVESSVPFDLPRPLNEKELDEVFFYCSNDVDATEVLYHQREAYLRTKINIGRECGLLPHQALAFTNAQLTAKFLGAEWKEHHDEREYVYPSNIEWKYIPAGVKAFFDKIHDKSIPDAELWASSYEFDIGKSHWKIAWGGCHASQNGYVFKKAERPGRMLINADGASFYPSEIIEYGYLSRNVENPQKYADTKVKRIALKKQGNPLANDYKLVLNGANGATLLPVNPLYDPLMPRSVSITGQLILVAIATQLYTEVPQLEIVDGNTDGIAFEFNEADKDKVMAICDGWSKRYRIDLEYDYIDNLWKRDVNNYIELKQGGVPKLKGGDLVRGPSKAGAFKVNNQANAIAEAIVKFFTEGIMPRDYIESVTDIFKFQYIAKAGHSASRVYQLVNNEEVPCQFCNRVYATKDTSRGTIYKVEGGTRKKIGGLPPNCIIDNGNELSIDVVDREWYIEEAVRKINRFIPNSIQEDTEIDIFNLMKEI